MTHIHADWTHDAQYFEYTKAGNPLGAGLITNVPLASFSGRLHEPGPSRIVLFDLSSDLHTDGPATTPSLCANFVCIRPDEPVENAPERDGNARTYVSVKS